MHVQLTSCVHNVLSQGINTDRLQFGPSCVHLKNRRVLCSSTYEHLRRRRYFTVDPCSKSFSAAFVCDAGAVSLRRP